MYSDLNDDGRRQELCALCSAPMDRSQTGANPVYLRVVPLHGEVVGGVEDDATGGVLMRDDHEGVCFQCVSRHARRLLDMITSKHRDLIAAVAE